jgi:rubrerythrin
MSLNRWNISLLITAVFLVFAAAPRADALTAAAAKTATLDNLQAAYNGESNARAKYLAFAAKAEADGYPSVAKLFRAAAQAEDVHANNHAVVIRKLQAQPKAEIKTPEVKTTADNLKAAIDGETYERDKMYPGFIDVARQAGMTDAVRTFNLAKTAEAEHAKLYTGASEQLPNLKGITNVTYYVCPVCGFTTTTLPKEKCPSCFTPKDKFAAV